MRKYNLTIVAIIFLVSTAFITSAHPALLSSTSLSTQGNIDYNGHMGLPFLYSTDFETVTKQSSTSLNMGIENLFVMEGATMWVEGRDLTTPGITAHSGTKSIGMSGGTRNEFELNHLSNNFGITEYYVSIWIFLPVGFTVLDWYSIGDPIGGSTGDWLPQSETTILGGSPPTYPLIIESWGTWGSSSDPYTIISSVSGFPPVGRWFKYEFYVKLDPTNGVIKVWIDGEVICDVSPIRTIDYIGQPMTMSIAKIYGSEADGKKIWADDLKIYGR